MKKGMKQMLLIIALFCLRICPAQSYSIDSLLNYIKTAPNDTQKLKTLTLIGDLYSKSGNYEKAFEFVNKTINSSEQLISSASKIISVSAIKIKANAYSRIGSYSNDKGEYGKANENFLVALKLYEQVKYERGKAIVHNNMALNYLNSGDYPKALKHNLIALEIRERIKEKAGISTSFQHIATVYLEQKEYKKAEEYYSRALKMKKELKDKKGIANALTGLGSIYNHTGILEKALKMHEEALKIREELKDEKGIADCSVYIGNIYMNMNKYNEALQLYLKVLKVYRPLGRVERIILTYNNIGKAQTKLKQFNLAELNLNTALEMALGIRNNKHIQSSYEGLAQLKKFTGDWKGACEYKSKYFIYRDSLINDENLKKTVEAQMNFNFEKKEHKKKLDQEKKDVVTRAEQRRQKIIIISISIGLLMLLFLSIFIFSSLRQNQKINKIINLQKVEVEIQKNILETKQHEILSSIRYAKRIQMALITNENYFDRNLNRLLKT